MNWQDLNAIISIAAVAYIYLVIKPQQAAQNAIHAENNAIHESLDKIGIAIDRLSNELQASREDRVALKEQNKTLFNNHNEFKSEMRREIELLKKAIEEINKALVKKCERGPECLKK